MAFNYKLSVSELNDKNYSPGYSGASYDYAKGCIDAALPDSKSADMVRFDAENFHMAIHGIGTNNLSKHAQFYISAPAEDGSGFKSIVGTIHVPDGINKSAFAPLANLMQTAMSGDTRPTAEFMMNLLDVMRTVEQDYGNDVQFREIRELPPEQTYWGYGTRHDGKIYEPNAADDKLVCMIFTEGLYQFDDKRGNGFVNMGESGARLHINPIWQEGRKSTIGATREFAFTFENGDIISIYPSAKRNTYQVEYEDYADGTVRSLMDEIPAGIALDNLLDRISSCHVWQTTPAEIYDSLVSELSMENAEQILGQNVPEETR